MGIENVNGIQTPPARLFFPDFGPPTPTSMWTYSGNLGPDSALPELVIDFDSAPCEKRFVTWHQCLFFFIGEILHDLIINVVKFKVAGQGAFSWDDYYVELRIDGFAADDTVGFEVDNEFDYSPYRPIIPGTGWEWSFMGDVFQTVSTTRFYPCAWDRVLPGPPFPAP